MAEMAEVLGKHSEAAAYRRLFGQLASSFEKLYLSADGTVGVPTQSGYVLPLWIGLIPPDRVAAASEKLAERIAANDHRMATGFLGTRSLLLALTDSGHHDLAARLFQSRKFPSWGYEVEQGANSVWERWDSFTKEHGFDGATGTNNAAMNSFSHYSFGAVMEWAFRRLVGIDLVEPGYRRIRIAPRPPAAGSNPDARPIEWVNAEYESPRGAIQVSWRVGEGSFALQTSIPPNVRATVVLPAARAARVWLDGEDLDGSKQFSVERDEASARIELGSGQYRFDVR
jgi:alpha-L-rhamnosidase